MKISAVPDPLPPATTTAESGAVAVSAGLKLAAIVKQGQQHLVAGRIGEARALAEQVLREHPAHGPASHILGRCMLRQGQALEARNALLQALKARPYSTEIYVDLALALDATGDIRSATACISRALAFTPNDAGAMELSAGLRMRLGQPQIAEAQYRRVLGLDARRVGALMELGLLLVRGGKEREGIVELMRATVVEPFLAEAHVKLSLGLYAAKYPESIAIQPMRAAARLLPDEPYYAGVVGEHYRHYDMPTAMAYAKIALQALDKRAAADPVGAFGIRIIEENSILQRIGELMHQMEVHVKSGLLGWRKPMHGILLCDLRLTQYPTLFDYWRRYVPIVSDPEMIAKLEPLRSRIRYDPVTVILPDGKAYTRSRALLAVQEEWERQGRGPLMELTREHRAKGQATLARLGMPEGAWHVVVHARSASTFQEGSGHAERMRNADIEAFLQAIEEIVRRGGWVIRLGEPSMKRLPAMRQVIDYAHSEVRSDVMDIYCCASARFLLGSPSGLSMLPHAFGVPVALSNFFAGGDRPWSSHDLFLPKLYRRTSDGRLLSFDEMTTLPLALTYDANVIAARGLDTIDATPAEILELAVEMLDRLDGRVSYSAAENERQARYDALMNRIAPGWVRNRVGRAFLEQHRNLL